MTAGEKIQNQTFKNLLAREGKVLTLSRVEVDSEIRALINTNGQENTERRGNDQSDREHCEIWIPSDSNPMPKVGESLTEGGKSYRIQKRFPGPVKTALICKVAEVQS